MIESSTTPATTTNSMLLVPFTMPGFIPVQQTTSSAGVVNCGTPSIVQQPNGVVNGAQMVTASNNGIISAINAVNPKVSQKYHIYFPIFIFHMNF